MQIEFIGCTSAGKSTLASKVFQVCREHGLDAYMGDNFVLDQARLNWVQGRLIRTLLIDVISLFVCLASWRGNHEFYQFTLRTLWRLPNTVGWLQKLNIARNTFKKIAIYEIIRHRACDRQVVLLDEGTLHTAHYLFVHVSVEPNTSDLLTFISLVPLPDVVVYIKQSDSVLIERTLARGHKRISQHSYPQVERFVKRAIDVFDVLKQQPAIEERLMVVEGGENNAASQVIAALSNRPYRD
jgi:thymidylate kinase